MKVNPETDFYEADFVVAIRFMQPPEIIARLAEEIATNLRHIPRYWLLDDSMRHTVDMLFRDPKVLGSSISFDLPLAEKTKSGLTETITQLSEITESKLGGRVEKMIIGTEVLHLQFVLFGERSDALKRLRETPVALPSEKYPAQPEGYAERVEALEQEGMTTSDAQGIVDVEFGLLPTIPRSAATP